MDQLVFNERKRDEQKDKSEAKPGRGERWGSSITRPSISPCSAVLPMLRHERYALRNGRVGVHRYTHTITYTCIYSHTHEYKKSYRPLLDKRRSRAGAKDSAAPRRGRGAPLPLSALALRTRDQVMLTGARMRGLSRISCGAHCILCSFFFPPFLTSSSAALPLSLCFVFSRLSSNAGAFSNAPSSFTCRINQRAWISKA